MLSWNKSQYFDRPLCFQQQEGRSLLQESGNEVSYDNFRESLLAQNTDSNKKGRKQKKSSNIDVKKLPCYGAITSFFGNDYNLNRLFMLAKSINKELNINEVLQQKEIALYKWFDKNWYIIEPVLHLYQYVLPNKNPDVKKLYDELPGEINEKERVRVRTDGFNPKLCKFFDLVWQLFKESDDKGADKEKYLMLANALRKKDPTIFEIDRDAQRYKNVLLKWYKENESKIISLIDLFQYDATNKEIIQKLFNPLLDIFDDFEFEPYEYQ